jgi:hypothetical protein
MTTVERFEQNIDQVNSDFQAIKSKIIECGVAVADGTKTAELAEKVGDVYEAGKKSEYDEFWDAFQLNGERRNYQDTFTNSPNAWTPKNFKPKYSIICEGNNSSAFYAWEDRANPFNLGAYLKLKGITLDTSKATFLTNFFAYGYGFVGEFPTISCESAGANTTGLFRGVHVSKIEKIIVTEQTVYTSWFLNSGNYLVDVVFEGTIATGGLDMRSCNKLSKASIISIMEALSTTTTGLTVTLSRTAVDTAFAAEGETSGGIYREEWGNYVLARPNWTIALI